METAPPQIGVRDEGGGKKERNSGSGATTGWEEQLCTMTVNSEFKVMEGKPEQTKSKTAQPHVIQGLS